MNSEGRRNRIYNINECVIFAKTKAPFGGLSNMASGYPLLVNDNIIPSTEALYQAMRYSLFPKIQHEIISQSSPMTAKMISKKYNSYTRQDWEDIRIKVMRWALEVKLCQHWTAFSKLLRSTENRPIVEYSAKDKHWGAQKINDTQLSGTNALGRLLMELREKYIHENNSLNYVTPPSDIAGFHLYDYHIATIYNEESFLSNLDHKELEFA